MSWYISVSPADAQHLGGAIDSATLNHASGEGAAPSDEMKAALKAARDAVVAIVESGCLGTDGQYGVSISGHSNPDHVATGGWAPDSVSIQITHRPPQP